MLSGVVPSEPAVVGAPVSSEPAVVGALVSSEPAVVGASVPLWVVSAGALGAGPGRAGARVVVVTARGDDERQHRDDGDGNGVSATT